MLRELKFNTTYGKKVVTGSLDMTARIWDAETGKQLKKLSWGAGDISSVAFSPDGKKVVTEGSDKTTRFWDTETGEHLEKLEWRTRNSRSALSPDGKKVVSASVDGTARIWNLGNLAMMAGTQTAQRARNQRFYAQSMVFGEIRTLRSR